MIIPPALVAEVKINLLRHVSPLPTRLILVIFSILRLAGVWGSRVCHLVSICGTLEDDVCGELAAAGGGVSFAVLFSDTFHVVLCCKLTVPGVGSFGGA